MTLQLFALPFSSYCQKALIALYENDIPFEFRMLSPEEPANDEAFARLWPIQRFPILVAGGPTAASSRWARRIATSRSARRIGTLPTDEVMALRPLRP